MVMPTTLRNALAITLALFLVGAGDVHAQDRSVSGTVTDAETGESLPGVNVTAVGTDVGTSTDQQGEYSLAVPERADSLAFSFVGYQVLHDIAAALGLEYRRNGRRVTFYREKPAPSPSLGGAAGRSD